MDYTHDEILTRAKEEGRDLGQGYWKFRLRLSPGDRAYAPGTTKKEFVATGIGAYIDYTIHAMGWIAEPNGFLIVTYKGEL